MTITTSEFWAENHYDHPPLTDEMVAAAERELGVRLPAEYLTLLRVQNGGQTRGFIYPTPRSAAGAEGPVVLEHLNGIVLDPDHQTAQNILNPACLPPVAPLFPQRLGFMRDPASPLYRQVLLSSADGHCWVTLDYRGGEAPTVAYIDVEYGWEAQLAPSFAAFLDGLAPDPVVWT